MDSHRVVEVLLGSAHGYGDRNALHHLIDALADTTHAYNLQVRPCQPIIWLTILNANHLEKTLLLVLLICWRIEHVGEFRGENLYIVFAKLASGVLSGQPTVPDRWM